jgi:hypothetical protein
MKKITIVLAMIILVIGCAHSPNTIQIQEKVSEYDDVDTFVTWLKEQPNIRDVNVNKKLFLTSHPPKVIVTYYQNGARHKLLLAVEPDHKLKLVMPE